MKSYNKIMRNIEQLGERYCRENLDPWNKGKLQNNWWEALKFFFSHSFMRGRRDELSNKYYYFTIESLEEQFSITNGNLDSSYESLKGQREYFDKESILKFKRDKNIGRGNSVKNQGFWKEVAEKNPIVKLLIPPKEVKVKRDNKTYNKNKKIFLGNDEDVMMVLDVLKFISEDRQNIYNYLRNTISNSGVKAVYKELRGMRAIADKISALIIRDVVLMNPEIKIADDDYKLAFPVDTWVKQVAKGLDFKSDDIEEIKNHFTNKRLSNNPLTFNAGLWYLGSNSLDILLEDCLGKIEIGNNTSPNSG